MIELKNLTKKYVDFVAVDNLNLLVPKGEIFGFLGPNGAGKTTTIKMMGGINAPTSGSIIICGINMETDPEAAKNKIGFIPDRPYLYEKLTGMEFLKFTADLYGLEEDGFQHKAEDLLKTFSLFDWSDELIEAYSHGMKQRLVMSAALIHDPEVIIVDEPMVGLDPVAIKMVKNLFKRLAAEGVTIFMSTHTLKVAEEICHRIGIIHKGSLIETGTPEDLMRKANTSERDLEEVFIRLTEEEASAN
ncbi:MAG: ABC transporter ATP-binding protein [Deltaproteobacteria bacterium]|nr:ABC transporter ATP-binding protein [Deltaproteobacteria bacterium]